MVMVLALLGALRVSAAALPVKLLMLAKVPPMAVAVLSLRSTLTAAL